MPTNKFGKTAGPGQTATPGDNTVTTGKILDGTIAAADLGAKSVTAAKLGVDVAGTGLNGGNGAAVGVDLNGLTAATVAVAADSIAFIDATDDGTYKESIADLATAMAGTASSTGIVATSGVLAVRPNSLTAANVDVAADSIEIIDATDSLPKKEAIADVATAMAGSGLAATNGVLAASGLTIAHCVDDGSHSIFYVYGEHDFSGAAKVNTDLGAIGAKGTLIGGYVVMTQAVNGTNATATIVVGSSASDGGTPIATAHTVTQANTADGQSNEVGATRALAPVAAGVDMLSTAHVYVYTAADGTRSAGKAKVVCIFQKSA
jgi:hypothetical protein